MDTRYRRNAGAIFSLKYHLVWCPKYRRPVLTPDIEKRFRPLLTQKAAELGMTIMPDHVHLFVDGDLVLCVAEIVNRRKGFTAHQLRKEFSALQTRLADALVPLLLCGHGRQRQRMCREALQRNANDQENATRLQIPPVHERQSGARTPRNAVGATKRCAKSSRTSGTSGKNFGSLPLRSSGSMFQSFLPDPFSHLR